LNHRSQQLHNELLAGERKISEQVAAIEAYHKQIFDTKELKENIEKEKGNLDDATVNLRAKKVEETRMVKELEASIKQCEIQCGDKKKELAE